MSDPYRCAKCGTSTDAVRPLVLTARERDGSFREVSVHCQAPGCGNFATSRSIHEALALISARAVDNARRFE
jgi:predicted RNA-binding Zn-ribbon protein involved in translation (DUF1610 family)